MYICTVCTNKKCSYVSIRVDGAQSSRKARSASGRQPLSDTLSHSPSPRSESRGSAANPLGFAFASIPSSLPIRFAPVPVTAFSTPASATYTDEDNFSVTVARSISLALIPETLWANVSATQAIPAQYFVCLLKPCCTVEILLAATDVSSDLNSSEGFLSVPPEEPCSISLT